MREKMTQKQMEEAWVVCGKQSEMKGKNGTYRRDMSRFLGRGSYGIVYVGYQRNEKGQLREVAVKQFKLSETWKTDEDRDKEIVLFSKFEKALKSKYILQVIDVFRQKTGRWVMVSELARGGVLSDHLAQFINPTELLQLCQRLAKIIHYLHYEALADYRGENERVGEGGPLGIMHRDIKPHNIVWTDYRRSSDSLHLLDFGISKVVYTEQYKPYLNCGTNSYKAPQIGDGRIYCSNVDVYSFGCIVYQLITGGQRLLSHAGLKTVMQERTTFVDGKLDELQCKLKARNDEAGRELWQVEWWMNILRNSLAAVGQKRWSSKQLLDAVNRNSAPNARLVQVPGLKEIVEREELFSFNFEQFRLSLLQHKIDCLFEYLYFDQPKHNKFITFVFIKLVTVFIIEKFSALKRWADKRHPKEWQALKKTVHIERIQEINKNCPRKLEKEVEGEKDSKRMHKREGKGQIEQAVEAFPEILHLKPSEPRKILFEFCYQQRISILENSKIAAHLTSTLEFMHEMDNYVEGRPTREDFKGSNIQLFILKKLAAWRRRVEEEASKKGHKQILEDCHVQHTLRDNLNREENKTDVSVVLRSK